jgi:hypothetical protein
VLYPDPLKLDRFPLALAVEALSVGEHRPFVSEALWSFHPPSRGFDVVIPSHVQLRGGGWGGHSFGAVGGHFIVLFAGGSTGRCQGSSGRIVTPEAAQDGIGHRRGEVSEVSEVSGFPSQLSSITAEKPETRPSRRARARSRRTRWKITDFTDFTDQG